MRGFLMTTTVLAMGLAPGIASAQAQPSSAAASAEQAQPLSTGGTSTTAGEAGATAQNDASAGLGDIIVTAQRRAESAQRAAIAINVVGGSDLIGAGITNSNRLGALVPSLTIQQIGPSNTSFIRGVGNFSVSVTNDPAVAFNYDGVYVGRLNATSGTFFDLDRIEVLKGPQGTLYGRNATAGVINVLPAQPKLGQFGGYATLSYGNYNALTGEGAINVPVGQNAAFRVSGTVTHRDGYLKDGTSDDKTEAARAQFKFAPDPSLKIRVAGDYTHLGGKGAGLSYLNTFTATTTTPTGLPRSEGILTPAAQAFWQALGAGAIGQVRRTRDPFPDTWQNSNFYGANAEVVYDTGVGVLTFIPAARWDHIRNVNPSGGFPIANNQRDRQYTVEGRFAGKLGMFDYTLGAFYFNERVRLNSGTVTFGSNVNHATTALDTESYAPFARLSANLTPRLRLVGGIRYTHDHKDLNASIISLAVNCTVPFTCTNTVLPRAVVYPGAQPFAIPANGQTLPGPVAGTSVTRSDVAFVNSANFPKTTWRGAVEFDVAPASLLYGSVETGFRSGGFNTSVGFETFQPEYITAYTIGMKNRFLNNRLQLNIEAFYWRYRNQQVAHPAFDRGIPPRPNSITENVGRSTIKGVEIETRFLATKTTVLSADIQYLDAVDKSFTYITSAALQARTGCPSAPNPVATVPATVVVNCAGFPAFAAPKWSLNLAAEQTIPVGSYKAVLGVDTQFKTKRYLGFEYQPEQLQGSSWTTNAQVAFGPADNRWSIAGYVRNLENRRLLVAPFAFAGLLVAYTSPPITYGVRGSVKF